MRALPEGGYDLFAALRDGAPLGEAAEPLIAAGGDPGAHLVGLFEAGAVIGLDLTSAPANSGQRPRLEFPKHVDRVGAP